MFQQSFLTGYDDGYDYELDETGDKKTVSGSEEVAVHIRERLQFFKNEWIFNLNAGFPWFQRVFVKPVNLNIVNSLIKRHILQTPGVTGIVEYNGQITEGRSFRIDFRYTDAFTTAESLALSITLP